MLNPRPSPATALLALSLLLAGCSTLPGQGPSRRQMAKDANEPEETREYAVVKLDVATVQKLGGPRPPVLNREFSTTAAGKAGSLLGIGDVLLVNIWETSGDGLFSTFEQKQSSLDAMIDETGTIYIPYVGAVAAAGKTIEEVRRAIETGLKGKAVEPQVQVALKHNVSNNLIVVGDVNQPGRYDIPIGGIRLLEAIARAGGSRPPIFEAEATLVRGDTRSTIRLDEILGQRNNNVWLQPSDTVQIMHKPRTFTAFGAVTSKNRHPFTTESLSLAEALAQAGGLNDGLADAGGVFLFRFEPPGLLDETGADLPETLFGGRAATIYQLDFKQPEAFFLARSFAMQDQDILYVANAFAAEYYKFIRIYVQPLLDVSRTGSVVIE